MWNVETCKRIKTHMVYSNEAYVDERAAISRGLESFSRRNTTPERVIIFTGV